MSRPALWPTQLPLRRVLGFFPAGKRLGRDVDHSAPSSDEDKNE